MICLRPLRRSTQFTWTPPTLRGRLQAFPTRQQAFRTREGHAGGHPRSITSAVGDPRVQTRNHELGTDRIDTGTMCADTMDDQDDDAGTPATLNEHLAQRLRTKGLSHARFATAVGVDVKTVRRWLANANSRSATITPTVPPTCSTAPRMTCGLTNSYPPQHAHWRQPRRAGRSPRPCTPAALSYQSPPGSNICRRHHRYRHPGPCSHIPIRHPRRIPRHPARRRRPRCCGAISHR